MNKTVSKIISLLLIASFLIIPLSGCTSISSEERTKAIAAAITNDLRMQFLLSNVVPNAAESREPQDVESFVYNTVYSEYSLIYDVFHAAMVLPDGSEVPGIAYTDYAYYLEDEGSEKGYFPVGFIADIGYEVPDKEKETGLVVENLDFTDNNYQFVYGYDTGIFQEHCVLNGQYLKYGVNDKGALEYSTSKYERGSCDETLGALYSFDEGRFVFDPDVGNYKRISGTSLSEALDFAQLEDRINRIIEEQNLNFSSQEITTAVQFAQESVVSYLLSTQEETFLGYNVQELVKAASEIDPMECIRITPEGYVLISVEGIPDGTPNDVAKWAVGIACGIVVIGSTALNLFVPVARPVSGAITGAAIDVFLQVVVENASVADVQWDKVAVAAVSGAMMAWLCPLAASQVTGAATTALNSQVLGKLCGYGVLTFSNSVVSGATAYANAKIDGSEDALNAALTGAALGACCTVGASILSETISSVGPKVTQLISNTKPGAWLNKATGNAALFIESHQVHLFESNKTIESILAPKSIHEAARQAMLELNGQTGAVGGSYNSLVNNGDGSSQKHEMPSFESYKKATGVNTRKDAALPAVKISAEDHRMTASYGYSADSIAYRQRQEQLVSAGRYQEAIQMDIDDLTAKFGTKYAKEISQMIEYAKEIGWWK